jgi:hypothetical protein
VERNCSGRAFCDAPTLFNMPAPKRGQSIERTSERDEFMRKLAEYHEKRG